MTVEGATALIAVLTDAYPGAKFSESSPRTWAMILSTYSDDEVMAVLPAVMKASPEFCPSAPMIAKAIDEAKRPPINAAHAWEFVHEAINWAGCERPTSCRLRIRETIPEYADVIINAADAIGWTRLGTTEYKDHGTLFAQFERCLKAAVKGEELDQRREQIEAAANGSLGWGVTAEDMAAPRLPERS